MFLFTLLYFFLDQLKLIHRDLTRLDVKTSIVR